MTEYMERLIDCKDIRHVKTRCSTCTAEFVIDLENEGQWRTFGMDAKEDASMRPVFCPFCQTSFPKPIRVALRSLREFLAYLDLAEAPLHMRFTDVRQ